MSKMASSFKSLLKEKKKLEKQISEQGEKHIKEAFRSFFKDHGKIVEAVSWSQYTPHFNDGDECVFGINEFSIKLTDPELNEKFSDGYSENCDTYTLDKLIESGEYQQDPRLSGLPEALAAVGEIEEAIGELGNHMAEILGDHIKVTATAESLEVEEYEHD